MRRFKVNRGPAIAALVIVGAVLLAACGSAGNGGGGGGKGPLVIANVGPFTGADADYGSVQIAGCAPAALLINRDGGVLGHQVTCKTVDTHGDAADAVPAVQQLLATTGNLAGIIGPSSDEATATVPAIERQHVTDVRQHRARSLRQQYVQVSLAFDASGRRRWPCHGGVGPQAGLHPGGRRVWQRCRFPGTVKTLFQAFTTKLGGHIVANERIAPGQPSYRSEVESVIASHPQVIFDEIDPQSAATFFSELSTLNGKPVPAIGAIRRRRPSSTTPSSGRTDSRMSSSTSRPRIPVPTPRDRLGKHSIRRSCNQAARCRILASGAPSPTRSTITMPSTSWRWR